MNKSTLMGCSFILDFKMCVYIMIFAIDPIIEDPASMIQRIIFKGFDNVRMKNLSSEKLASFSK